MMIVGSTVLIKLTQSYHFDLASHELPMKFQFSGILVGAQFESQLSSHISDASITSLNGIHSAQFDLREVSFMDCYCAQVLICYIRYFDRRGTTVSVKLPQRKAVRDILRIWNFDEALRDAVGSRLIRFCDEDDRSHYFPPHEFQSTFNPTLFPAIYPPPNDTGNNSDLESIPRTNFFGFRTIRVPSLETKAQCAFAEKELWQTPNVRRILERDLKIDVRFFTARIIFEAAFNALRHSSAEIVQTATHTRYIYELSQKRLPFEDRETPLPIQRTPSKSAVVHYWDDGASIVDIIDKNLAHGNGRRTFPAGDFATSYRLLWKPWNENEPSTDRIITTSEDADSQSHLSEKLLFILQPYVSMAPSLYGHTSTTETIEDDSRLASVGMGLYLLLDTTIRMFGGKVRIRTANIHMDIYKGKKQHKTGGKTIPKHDYTVEIREMSPLLPRFSGNLITISIPEQNVIRKRS